MHNTPLHTTAWFACVAAVLTLDMGSFYCRLSALQNYEWLDALIQQYHGDATITALSSGEAQSMGPLLATNG